MIFHFSVVQVNFIFCSLKALYFFISCKMLPYYVYYYFILNGGGWMIFYFYSIVKVLFFCLLNFIELFHIL